MCGQTGESIVESNKMEEAVENDDWSHPEICQCFYVHNKMVYTVLIFFFFLHKYVE